MEASHPIDDGNESSDDFRYTPDSGHRPPSRPCPKSAKSRLMHRSNDEAISSFRQAGGLQSPRWFAEFLGLSLEKEFPEDACRVEGSSKANFFFARQ
jgi:hypothetical protein